VAVDFKRLPYFNHYFDLDADPDKISADEQRISDADILIFQSGQWPAAYVVADIVGMHDRGQPAQDD
jgi:hypothetical protein